MARLLVIEDELEARTALSEALRRDGHSVLAFDSGTPAVEEFKRHPVDLVFCDLRMSGLDGLATLRTLKNMDPWVTVVMVTAFGSIEAVAHLFQSGAYDVLEKPFTLKQIQQLAKRALDHRRKLKEIAHMQGAPGVAKDVPSRLRELERFKADFLEMAMKDLRTPLKLLQEDAALIRKGYYGLRDALRQQQLLGRVERVCTLLKRLTESARAIFIGQEQRLHITACNLQNAFDEIIRSAQLACSEKEIRLHLQLPKSSLTGPTDAEKVWCVVEDLLMNTVERSRPQDEIRFSMEGIPEGFRIEISSLLVLEPSFAAPSLLRHYVDLLGGKFRTQVEGKEQRITIDLPWLKNPSSEKKAA